jgi:uncharacterized protein (TIGR02145 family)
VTLEDKDIIECVALFNKYTRASVPTYPIPLSDEDKQLLIDRVYLEYARYTSDNTDKSIVIADKDYFTYSDFVKVIWKVFRDNLPSPTLSIDDQYVVPMPLLNYGLLYNWYAVADIRNIAPLGWHVPLDNEFTTMINFLGGRPVAGGHLKDSGYIRWSAPNTGADNSSGFSAIGVGWRFYDGSFINGTYQCIYNASDDFLDFVASGLTLLTSSALAGHTNGNALERKRYGVSIRLVKDDSVDSGLMTDNDGNSYPTVTIGTQVWMARNLKETKYRDGSLIPIITDNSAWSVLTTGALCAYNNDWSNV